MSLFVYNMREQNSMMLITIIVFYSQLNSDTYSKKLHKNLQTIPDNLVE